MFGSDSPLCYLLDTLYRASLYASPARLAAVTEVRHIPPRGAGVLVTRPHLYLQPLVGVAEVGRHGVLSPALHADHDGLLEAAEAGGRARGEAGDLPCVGRLQGSGGLVQRLLLAVHQRQDLRPQLLAPHQGVAHDADGVGEHLLRPAARPVHADLRLRGLEARALAVWQGRHRLAELQEDLAGNLAEADSLPAGGRAGGPLVGDEAGGGGVREQEGREG